MGCFCFLVDQKRRVGMTKPVAGLCSRCGGAAKVADVKTYTRFCFIPFYYKSSKAIFCVLCGATLRSYN